MRARLLAAGVLATAVTATAPIAAPAQAATVRQWDRVAQCESGGRWHINTHNGYYGGLQFSARTWRAFGGRQFAYWPHRAGKYEQIKVANRVLRHQGWGAWPVCGRRA